MVPHGGRIVAEFFDVDKSRSIPPQRRPQASALLAALADPRRGFDAVVVGEPQRAFYGNPLRQVRAEGFEIEQRQRFKLGLIERLAASLDTLPGLASRGAG